jgi:YVTN family beta-propeller protein
MTGAGAFAVLLTGTVFGSAQPIFPERPPATSPRTAAVDVGGHPGRIALAESGLWVTVYGGRRNKVVRIDPETNRVTARIAVRGGPFEIATASGAVWVTGNFRRGDDVLHRIDPRTERVVGTIRLPGRYAGAVAAGRRAVWVVASDRTAGASSLVEVDPSTNTIVSAVPLMAARRWVTDLALARGDLWLLALKLGRHGELPGDMLRFDPDTQRVTAVVEAKALSVGTGPGGVWASGCIECGVHRRSFFAQRIDTRSNESAGPRIALRRVGFGPLFVGRKSVWFGGYEQASETIAFSLDRERGRIERFLRLGSVLHTGMAVDPRRHQLWVARATGEVLRVDLPDR